MSRLIHYSRAPLASVYSVEQRENPDMKPRGLWVSVEGENDWRWWCEAESFALDCLKHETLVTVTENANILWLKSPLEIDEFHRLFVAHGHPYDSGLFVNWRNVAEQYQGIIIAPYQWSRRLDGKARWYYGWDCASGCIWDENAIQIANPPQGKGKE